MAAPSRPCPASCRTSWSLQAHEELNLQVALDQAVLQQKITQGLDRLYDFQHDDGGWGWWKTDESQIFMTAYVVSGLAQAQAAGQTIKPGVLDKAVKYLKQQYQSESRLIPDLKAYLNYALVAAGATDRSMLEDAWQHHSKMSAYGLAQIGLAFDALKDPRAQEAARQLVSMARQDEAEASWPLDEDTLMDVMIDSTPQASAYAVKLLSHVDPQNPLLPKAALWLVNHRSGGWYWFSTEQTAMVVYGLTDYLKTTHELNAALTATVSVNGKQVTSKAFTSADALSPGEYVVRLDEGQIGAAANQVRIAMQGTGRLYWSVRQQYNSTEPKLERTGSVQLNILRDYYRLSPAKQDNRIVYDLNALNGPVAVGDILAVRLTVTGGAWRYLMMEDPIPAGAEFIERDDLYELREKPSWWDFFFTRREMHDNRMAIFQTFFGEGQHQYFYLLKVVNPGLFHVNPARVQPMYQPNYLATTEARTVEAK